MKKRQRLFWAFAALIGVPLGCLALLAELAKHDAREQYRAHGVTGASIAEVRLSRSHGLWFKVKFTGTTVDFYGMHWYLLPWREHHIIK